MQNECLFKNIYVISGLRVTNKVEKLQVIKGRTYTLLVLVYSWDFADNKKRHSAALSFNNVTVSLTL